MGIAGWVFVAVVVLLLLYVIGVYNRLVRLRALVQEGFRGSRFNCAAAPISSPTSSRP